MYIFNQSSKYTRLAFKKITENWVYDFINNWKNLRGIKVDWDIFYICIVLTCITLTSISVSEYNISIPCGNNLTFDFHPSWCDVSAEIVGCLTGVETRILQESFPDVQRRYALHEAQLVLGLILCQLLVVCFTCKWNEEYTLISWWQYCKITLKISSSSPQFTALLKAINWQHMNKNLTTSK